MPQQIHCISKCFKCHYTCICTSGTIHTKPAIGLNHWEQFWIVQDPKPRLFVLLHAQIWDTVEKYDTGCTPGGGKNGISVFYDAGLLFESNTASGTAYRQGLHSYCFPPPTNLFPENPNLGKHLRKHFFFFLCWLQQSTMVTTNAHILCP